MKTKEEVIREAWEELGIDISNTNISENGYIKVKPSQYSAKYSELEVLRFSENKWSIRPKSLQGLENNNGWISLNGTEIETEYEGDLWIINQRGDLEFYGKDDFLIPGDAIMWQPVEEPKLPLHR
ncbi:hypothetical protein [Myroides odoratus]|uniref:hypothetical protein n=1 Tax=Myroides odoratus TaxID=256 RepID=UPI0039B0C8C3